MGGINACQFCGFSVIRPGSGTCGSGGVGGVGAARPFGLLHCAEEWWVEGNPFFQSHLLQTWVGQTMFKRSAPGPVQRQPKGGCLNRMCLHMFEQGVGQPFKPSCHQLRSLGS